MSKKSFQQLMTEHERRNRQALIRKAREANNLAKVTGGRAQKKLYAVKTSTVQAIMKKFECDVRGDMATPGMVSVIISNAGFRIHIPARAVAVG